MPEGYDQMDYVRLAQGEGFGSETETPDQQAEAQVENPVVEQIASETAETPNSKSAAPEQEPTDQDQKEEAERREQIINPTLKAGLALANGIFFTIMKGAGEKFGGLPGELFPMSEQERQSIKEKGWIKTAQEKVVGTLNAIDGIEDTIRTVAKRSPGAFQ